MAGPTYPVLYRWVYAIYQGAYNLLSITLLMKVVRVAQLDQLMAINMMFMDLNPDWGAFDEKPSASFESCSNQDQGV